MGVLLAVVMVRCAVMRVCRCAESDWSEVGHCVTQLHTMCSVRVSEIWG